MFGRRPARPSTAPAKALSETTGSECDVFGGPLAQLVFDPLVDVAAGELGSHADGVLNGVGVGPAVADNADAAHPQQWRTAVFGIVHALLEILEGRPRKHVSNLTGDGGGQ